MRADGHEQRYPSDPQDLAVPEDRRADLMVHAISEQVKHLRQLGAHIRCRLQAIETVVERHSDPHAPQQVVKLFRSPALKVGRGEATSVEKFDEVIDSVEIIEVEEPPDRTAEQGVVGAGFVGQLPHGSAQLSE